MQEALEESVQMMKEAVDDLGATLAEAASAAGAVGGMVDSINDAINRMEETPTLEPEGTFVDYQTTMVKTAKAIAVTVQEMVGAVIFSQMKQKIPTQRNESQRIPHAHPGPVENSHTLTRPQSPRLSPSRSPSRTPTPMTSAVWPTS